MSWRCIACAAWLFAPAVLAAPQADLVFVNGELYTVDSARSWASALAVRNGTIAYVGNDREARALIGPGTRVIDLARRMLLPGFQDSHVHPGLVPNPANTLDLRDITDREQLFARIRRFATAHAAKPWIVGSGWNEALFLPSGQPTREMLDAIVPDRPAFLINDSQHQAWVNTRALAAATITAATADPVNGRIERDPSGRPAGVLQEAAMDLVRTVIPAPDLDERIEDLSLALQSMNRLGITAIEDALVKPDELRAYRALAERGKLPMRTSLCQYFDPTGDDAAQLHHFESERAELTSTTLRASCVKIVLDGAYGSHTVALLQPYVDAAKFGTGKLFVEPERLKRLVVSLDAAGFQVHVHAIGDRAVRTALDAIEAARQANGMRDNRHTLAHLALIDESDVPRFRALRVVANMTPLWSRGDPWETVFAPRMFGADRSRRLYRSRTLLDAGAVLVWGSDWPVTDVAPLAGIETATTRRYLGGRDPAGVEDRAWIAAERVSLEQALVAYTAAGAYLAHDEQRRGSLEVGKAADLVVLERNLFATPALAIHAVQVDMTVLGGHIVYERTRPAGPAPRGEQITPM